MKWLNCVLVILFLFSCVDKKGNGIEKSFYPQRIKSFSLDNMYVPRDICCLDSFLIINDYGNEDIYSVFKTENMFPIYSFGNRGEGPKDYIFPEKMKILEDGVHIFDRALAKFNKFCFNINNEPCHSFVKKDALLVGLNNVIPVNDSLCVALSYGDKARYVVLKNDSLYSSSINYPDDGIAASNIKKSLVYQGLLLKHPSMNKFVFSSYYGKILEILELDENEDLNLIYSSYEIFPQYVPNENSSTEMLDENLTGFLTASVSNEYIYLLYSGMTKKDKNRNLSAKIEVYDWGGNMLRTILLDTLLSEFCVNIDNKILYGISMDEMDNYDLVLYDISDF